MRRLPANRYLLFFTIALAGSAFDVLSKDAVFNDLGYPAGFNLPFEVGQHEIFAHPAQIEGRSDPFVDSWVGFRLYTSFNEGALWGFGQGMQTVFVVLACVALVGVVGWLFVFRAAESVWLTLCLALITAGTLGNLYDRVGWHGYVDPSNGPIYAVRDFLLFTFGEWPWPVFNFADVFLVTGAALLVLQSVLIEFGKAQQPGVDQDRAQSPDTESSDPPAKASGRQQLAS